MTFEEQIRFYKELGNKIDELETQRKELGRSILQAMKSKSQVIGDFMVKRHSRLSITMTPDEARPFNAVKFEEIVDKDKIKELYKNGTPLPNVKETEYIVVTQRKEVPAAVI